MLISFTNLTKAQPTYSCSFSTYAEVCDIDYPCPNPDDCAPFEIIFDPGYYLFELYGPSGADSKNYVSRIRSKGKPAGNEPNCLVDDQTMTRIQGNAPCITDTRENSFSGAGGYSKGLLKIQKRMKGFLTIGGKGYPSPINSSCLTNEACDNENLKPKGGYNGGGRGFSSSVSNSGSGSTDLRMLKDDPYHRILVAGGGGSGDDFWYSNPMYESEDGSGGAGGAEIAQSFWINGEYKQQYEANQTFGYSFFQGEASRIGGSSHPNGVKPGNLNDVPGASGGWFGGFSSQRGNGGSGGGSSFALTSKSKLPKEKLTVTDDFGNEISSDYYAFDQNSELCLTEIELLAGVWVGNGKARITSYYTTLEFTNSKKLRISKQKIFGFFLFLSE